MKIQMFADGGQISAYADRPEWKISLRCDDSNIPIEWAGKHICEVRDSFKQTLEKAEKIYIVIE